MVVELSDLLILPSYLTYLLDLPAWPTHLAYLPDITIEIGHFCKSCDGCHIILIDIRTKTTIKTRGIEENLMFNLGMHVWTRGDI